jgi:hypothetical protein
VLKIILLHASEQSTNRQQKLGERKPCFSGFSIVGQLFGLNKQLFTNCKSLAFISIFFII